LNYKAIIEKRLNKFAQHIGRYPVFLCLAIKGNPGFVVDPESDVAIKN